MATLQGASRLRAAARLRLYYQGRRLPWRRVLGQAVIYLLLIAGSAVFMVPFLWMLSSSLKMRTEVFLFPPRPLPKVFQWHNYYDALTAAPFGQYFLNSIYVAATVVLGTTISSSMVGYGFARIRGWGSGVLFAIVLSTMMLPDQVTMIPVYIMFSRLGWVNTYLPLTVPHFFGSAFNIFLFRQFFRGISPELSDAAKIDGCGHGGLYSRIIMPIARPAVATVALMAFMWSWNGFLGPLIYLHSQRLYTVPLGLAMFSTYYSAQTPWHWLMAASIVALLPLLVLFFLAQKIFVQGIVVTGIK
jgi:ABC-type glycerol-3-phosphate transport system permease component